MSEMQGRLALVTGATGGIGKATCFALASMGCNVALHYHAAEETARDVAAALRAKGVAAEIFQADLKDYDHVSDLVYAC